MKTECYDSSKQQLFKFPLAHTHAAAREERIKTRAVSAKTTNEVSVQIKL